MVRILLSAFACNPNVGSESSYGYYWAHELAAKGFNVVCITRAVNRTDLSKLDNHPNLSFIFVDLPFGLERLYNFRTAGLYIYYLLWQWKTFLISKKLNKVKRFDIIHHVTFASLQLGSFMYKLRIPFVFGPTGGGQMPPKVLKKYFDDGWELEQKRERISKLMLKYNPACFRAIKKSDAILASNYDTRLLAEKFSPKKIFDVLDTCLRDDFIPLQCPQRRIGDKIKLLWLGRVFPRKGILLAIEVMKILKENDRVELTIVGDGPFMNKMIEKVKEYGLEKTVSILGRVDYNKVSEVYLNHHFLLFTSLRDAVGVQMVEAMAFGLPVIGLNIHGQSQVIQANRGVKVDVDENSNVAEKLAKAILQLIENKAFYEAMSKAAYEFAKENAFSKKVDFVVNTVYPAVI